LSASQAVARHATTFIVAVALLACLCCCVRGLLQALGYGTANERDAQGRMAVAVEDEEEEDDGEDEDEDEDVA
jgi:hypothetical protein